LSSVGDHPWSHRDLKLWAEWLNPKGILRPGAKALIDESDDSLSVTTERLHELFESAAVDALLAASSDPKQLLQLWSRRVAPAFHKRVQFPVAVALARGPSALEESPRVTVGTIHSVKGGEADVVFLFPDLSPAGEAAYQRHGAQRDSVIRLFYVGMTRARHTLYVCQRESSMAVVI
jgi:superfamily I DNA/RNA helicase